MRLARQFPNLRRILTYADLRRALPALGVGVVDRCKCGKRAISGARIERGGEKNRRNSGELRYA
jgi:hypothetical protein